MLHSPLQAQQEAGKEATRHPQSSQRKRVNAPRQQGTAAIPACHNHSEPSRLRPSH